MFKGKNVIITGCNRGIGKALMERFAKEGANIWAHARKKTEEFENEISTLTEKYGVSIYPIYFDLKDFEAIKLAVTEIRKSKQRIDILVNNAGIAHGGLLSMTRIEDLQEVFQINYFAQILLIQQVSRIMMRQKLGNIINMASVGGIEANAGYLAYGSSKASLIWATKCISKELAPYSIRVNAVAPGLTKTEMGMYKSEEELQKTINTTSLKRMAEVSEVVNAVLFLASEDSSFITGHVLSVDGGRY